MTLEAQARAAAKADALRAEMPSQKIQQARGLYQKMLAEVSKVNRLSTGQYIRLRRDTLGAF